MPPKGLSNSFLAASCKLSVQTADFCSKDSEKNKKMPPDAILSFFLRQEIYVLSKVAPSDEQTISEQLWGIFPQEKSQKFSRTSNAPLAVH